MPAILPADMTMEDYHEWLSAVYHLHRMAYRYATCPADQKDCSCDDLKQACEEFQRLSDMDDVRIT